MSAANPFFGGMSDKATCVGFGSDQSRNGALVPEQTKGAFGFSSQTEQLQYAQRLQVSRGVHQERVARLRRALSRDGPILDLALPVIDPASQCRSSNVGTPPMKHPASRLDDNERLKLLEEKTGHMFKNRDLAKAALDMAELSNEHLGRRLKKGVGTSCQNLAIVGDQVLEMALLDKWFEIASTPATWTFVKQRVTPNFVLEKLCTDSRLYDCAAGQWSGVWPRATLVEAVLGAVYMDSGKSLAAVQNTMEWLGIMQLGMKVLREAEAMRATGALKQDGTEFRVRKAKNRLQKRMQKRRKSDADSVVIEISSDEDNDDKADQGDAGNDEASGYDAVGGESISRSGRDPPRASSV